MPGNNLGKAIDHTDERFFEVIGTAAQAIE
jgi:hypothetical protein